MGQSTDLHVAVQLLNGLENGGHPVSELATAAEDLDPLLLYGIVTFLRSSYPATDPVATPVLERVVELSGAYSGFVNQCKEGEDDPVGEWMREEIDLHSFRGRGDGLLRLLVEKLET
ncbi:MAG: hypothetical protein OEV00_12300 [Acidobacteriota bacterium]|nr:hypothetical protein [Acidobacteriota bacterium]MDH3786092.1 hypothetical protein [Acidobacteriota bacterium]